MAKYLLIFEKGEPVRWLGHLDILRTFERAIRRSRLPIAFSNGFNPRERLAFASALGTGHTGAAERAILELTDPLDSRQIIEQLNTALPPGIHIVDCQEIDALGAKETLAGLDRAIYAVVCACPPDLSVVEVEVAVKTLLARAQVDVTREREGRSKTVDLRPHLYSLMLRQESLAGERLTLEMCIGQGESGNIKPGEVVTALAEHLPCLRMRSAHRVCMLKAEKEI